MREFIFDLLIMLTASTGLFLTFEIGGLETMILVAFAWVIKNQYKEYIKNND